MNSESRSRLAKLARSQHRACRDILSRAAKVGFYFNAGDHAIFDALFVKAFYARSLKMLLPIATSNAVTCEWAAHLCSSLVDDGVYGRGLLFQALRIAADSDLFTKADAPKFARLLGGNVPCNDTCVVAYLDYVGATGNLIWKVFPALWRTMLVDATSRGFVGYYWRSSDSIYLVRCLGRSPTEPEKTDACAAMLDLLLHIQTHRCLPDHKKGWMWQMGVSLEPGAVIGDIFLPGKGGPQAATGMKEGVDKIRGGGVMLVTESFKNALPKNKKGFIRAPLVGKGKVVGKKEVKWFYYKSSAVI